MRTGASVAFGTVTAPPLGGSLRRFNRRRRRQNELALSPGKRIWLISFTDLMSLMTAFFVMMYAMSELDKGKYQEVRETFERYLGSMAEITPKPYLAPPLKLGDVDNIPLPRVRYASGLDPQYLGTVLSQKQSKVPILQRMTLVTADKQVSLDWPMTDFSALLAPGVITELADVLSAVPNNIALRLDISSNRAEDVMEALQQSESLRSALADVGYRGHMPTEIQIVSGRESHRLHLVIDRSVERTAP
jgi:hypothetical protein